MSLTLLNDLYQLTMAYGYWKAGMADHEAVFHLFFRKQTFKGGFTVAAGLESIIDFINTFRFTKEDLDYLATLTAFDGSPLFEPAFFTYLKELRCTCDIDAVPEGTVVFPFEPLIRVRGPLITCQLLETPLLNLFNYASLIATKAARMTLAARGDPVIEFGVRRAQGKDGALTASRSAYIGGCDSTSNLLAGKIFGIPVKGTHSHSWVTAFDNELESFRTFATHLPNNTILLVDTFNTIEGVKNAIIVAKELKKQNKPFLGIRLDSGDLTDLSIQARQLLDDAGYPDAQIVASNELDETLIAELKRQGAKITIWGVGTHLVTGHDQPALDGVYKLSAIRPPNSPWQYKLKLSEQMTKISNPGILQARRFTHNGTYLADAIYDIDHVPTTWTLIDPFDPTRETTISAASHDLLLPIFRHGEQVYTSPPLPTIRATTQENLSHLPTGTKRFLNPHLYPVGMEQTLYKLKISLIKNIRQKISSQ